MVHANQGKSLLTSHDHFSNTPSTLHCRSHAPTFKTLSHIVLLHSDHRPTSVTIKLHKNFKITMSNTTDSSPIKDQLTVSPSKEKSSVMITHAVPLTTVHPQSSKRKKTKSSTVKKEKPSKVSETSSPSAVIKLTKSKGKKSTSTVGPKIALTMSDLYLKDNPFQTSNVDSKVDASVEGSVVSNVETSVKASETLDLENPKSTENLGEPILNSADDTNVGVGSSTKAMIDSAQENKKGGIVPETPEEEVEHVTASGNEKSQDKMMTGNEEVSDEYADANSQSGESKKTVSTNEEESVFADKSVAADANVVNVDDIQSGEVSVERTPGPSIANRLRSRSGKVVASASE
ncbi:hypothetical protein A2U01_0012835, partial [Trifolium medium]|nr:hypothetical protein [Trifolium medium]